MKTITGWKIFTHDFCSPVQGSAPIWDGSEGFLLPAVKLDRGTAECAAGWNFCRDLLAALLVSGLWPNGRPSVAYSVETEGDWVERGDKCRAEQLRLVRRASEKEIGEAIFKFSACFKEYQQAMTDEQIAWREALGRPLRDAKKVESVLSLALKTRELNWTLKKFEDAWAARAARDARAAGAARAARAAWDAWDAGDAWDALIVYFAAKKEWIKSPADLLTMGLREAYQYGLAIVLPIGPEELGWAMIA